MNGPALGKVTVLSAHILDVLVGRPRRSRPARAASGCGRSGRLAGMLVLDFLSRSQSAVAGRIKEQIP